MTEEIQRCLTSAKFTDLDRHFARFIERLAGGQRPELAMAAALVSCQRTAGHICADLNALAGTPLSTDEVSTTGALRLPEYSDWRRELLNTSVVGAPGEFKPLVLDGQGKLYLHRYWEYETSLARSIRSRLQPAEGVDHGRLREGLRQLFPATVPGEVDWQKVAAFGAVTRKFWVISGGPGTGKTRTVVVLLALLLEQSAGSNLRIAMAAPTGKAAARLQESLKKAKDQLTCTDNIKAQLPEEAVTIHRLLGTIPNSPYFRHDQANLLAADVVIIDEASMVDLALMAKLFAAIPPSARVILLGDKDQLSSVEAGAVLGDICSADRLNVFSPSFCRDFEQLTGERLPLKSIGQGTAGPGDALVQLQKNYRFGEQNGIHALSRAVNEGAAERVGALLRQTPPVPGVVWHALPSPERLKAALRERVLGVFGGVVAKTDPATALQEFQRFRILCALRDGPYGVAALNRLVEEILQEADLIQKTGAWYAGRPVMVTENDYQLDLFNGDIGITWPDPATKQLRVYFPGPDDQPRAVLPLRLSHHETVYAMTVHKSQGSEFAEVLLVLPERENPVVTRELVYTGLTRASQRVELWAGAEVLRKAVARQQARTSGLGDILWDRKVTTKS